MHPLESIIHAEIRERGPMTFARFMELALYHPEWGYYCKEQAASNIGRAGDFFTSVSVGPLFGRLLARQFAEWWKSMDRPDPFHIVECGGLNGQLAHDILTALQQDFPACWDATDYFLVEPLPRLEQVQRKSPASQHRMNRVDSISKLRGINGVIFGNELLDAFPVHRVEILHSVQDDNEWVEWCVREEKNNLIWSSKSSPVPLISGLPQNFSGMVEVCPQALKWLEDAAHILHHGYILLLDYGWTDEEYFQAPRPQGTVRGYRDHRLVENILADPGEQDLTAHVRWTPLMEEAKRLGLEVNEFIQQNRWLIRIMVERRMELTPKEVRQFNTLTHPEMMGTPFRALVLKSRPRKAHLTTFGWDGLQPGVDLDDSAGLLDLMEQADSGLTLR